MPKGIFWTTGTKNAPDALGRTLGANTPYTVEGRLRTAEALGQTFFEQGRPAVAEAVLRSVERGTEDDADKIGVLYWLGRALEAQGKGTDARGCYDRVLAVDVSFHDVADRVTSLSTGGEG